MQACGGHFCQNSIFATDIQNEWIIISPETHKELALNDHNRSVTLRVYKWNLTGPFGSICTLSELRGSLQIKHLRTTSTSWTPNVP